MTNKLMRAMLLLIVASFAVACGTQATPVFEAPDEEAIVEVNAANADGEEVAVVPTATIEPTDIPTEAPTDIPTIEPTEVPTEEPTAAPSDPIARLIAVRDAANGEMLFNEFFAQTGFACSTCHQVAAPGQLIGPSMYGIKNIAGARVEGEVAERYLYNSIMHPNDYVVEGFVEGVMPQTWGEVLTETEIYDIIAYLMTIEG